ncbi:MAG: hypothetical protein ABW202_07910 [Duganella sp.]
MTTNALHQARLLSNGSLTTLITGAGTGYTRLADCALSRWNGDRVEDAEGYFFYLRDADSGDLWSLAAQPCGGPHARSAQADEGIFQLGVTAHGISAQMAVTVDAARDVELRQVVLKNLSLQQRHIELTSYLEVVLNRQSDEASHPAFSKLFVQTWYADGALLAHRRPRGEGDPAVWMVHAASGGVAAGFDTDRTRFVGRGRDLRAPVALDGALSATVGNVLDPVFSLRRSVTLAPGEQVVLRFVLGAAGSRDQALALTAALTDDVQAALHQPPLGEEEERYVRALAAGEPAALPAAADRAATGPATVPEPAPLQFFNGYGGFNAAGDEYVVRLDWDAASGLRRPPLAWTNAISNENFGFLVSESGAGYTWSRNSRVHRLTPWYNDPLRDPHGEALYLRDEDSGQFWSPLPGPAPATAGYEAAHGFGYSRFTHVSHDLVQETLMFVPRHDPVKIIRVRVTNSGSQPRRLSLFSYQRLVLGGTPADSSHHVHTAFDASGVLLAHNPQAGQFADGVTFAAVHAGPGATVHRSADRAAFIGLHGSPAAPAALAVPVLSESSGSGIDPCAAFQAVYTLAPGATLECVFLLGETVEQQAALALVQRYAAPGAVQQALEQITGFWRDTLGAVQVSTPAPAVDLMQNGWLAYQNLSCRIWGRSAYYQSGGALGYRDQLQDSSAMIYARPDLTRQQIRIHAAHQFVEGDVLHWWHTAPLEQGLRTRFSDDLLWLPYITAFYIRSSGDWSVLDEVEPFLTAPLLEEGEDEVYLKPELSGTSADIYEHCCRALDRSLTQGAHGLPLMGTGDWNDGMNRVGREGRGESVWMGFFLSRIIKDFLPICERRGDSARIIIYRAYHDHLDQALNDSGWDGAWYRRAFYDNGAVIGSKDSDECQIDALAQAWAVISEAAPQERAAQALDAMEQRLVSEHDGLIRLLTPAFVDTPNDPGYIKGYVAGVRENGGQYTHAACWAVRAMAEAGRRERAARLLEMLSPVSHALDPAAVAVYQVEPYVIAADIYGEAPHVGRGGWTWYTGSSGWMFRVGLESVLGFTIEGGDTIVLAPRIPDAWPEFSIRYRVPGDGGSYHITVRNPQGRAAEVLTAMLDGVAVTVADGAARIPLRRDGAAHSVELLLGEV